MRAEQLADAISCNWLAYATGPGFSSPPPRPDQTLDLSDCLWADSQARVMVRRLLSTDLAIAVQGTVAVFEAPNKVEFFLESLRQASGETLAQLLTQHDEGPNRSGLSAETLVELAEYLYKYRGIHRRAPLIRMSRP